MLCSSPPTLFLINILLLVQAACALKAGHPAHTSSYTAELIPSRHLRLSSYLTPRLDSSTSPTSKPLDGLRTQDTTVDDKRQHNAPPTSGVGILLRFSIDTEYEANALFNASNSLNVDVWGSTKDWVDVRVPLSVRSELQSQLPKSLLERCTTLMTESELTQAIARSYPSLGDTASFSPTLDVASVRGRNAFFDNYQPLSVIVPWMRLLSSLFPSHVRMITIGATYEGRDIYGLRVGVHPTNKDQKPKPRKTIIISGGPHSREWISTSTVTYVANYLITNYGRSSIVTKLLEHVDIVFVPTRNPDGYAYTWEHDRLWRKNRQGNGESQCVGIDLDRSWGYEWDGTTSSNPCSGRFAGRKPFEGVEAKALSDWAKNETENNNVEFVGLLDLHSYAQQVLYPYSHSCSVRPPSLENLQELGFGLAKAMHNRHGIHYEASSACEGNVFASHQNDTDRVSPRENHSGGGSALDWFYHDLRVSYTYQIMLRDTGIYGFLLPKRYIVPTGKETLSAVMYFGRFLLGEVGSMANPGVADGDSGYRNSSEDLDGGDPHVELR